MRPMYDRAGVRCFVDRVRGFLVPATPEEAVRQDVLDWLIDELGVPSERVRSEFSMARRKVGRGRADVLVLSPGSSDCDGGVLLVVECKRPEVFLDDKTLDQACGYAAKVAAPLLVLTNGGPRQAFARKGGSWLALDAVPSWRAMIAGRSTAWTPSVAPQRASWRDINTPAKCVALAESSDLHQDIFGEDSPEHLAPFVFNLFGFLAHGAFELPAGDDAIVIEKDLGRRTRWFGHHLGGGWWSEFYRSLLVRDRRSGSHHIVSATIIAGMRTENDPVYGNRAGRTYLCVATDREGASGMTLEMALDGIAIDERTSLVDLRHSGRLTAGRRGAVALRIVREFVRDRAPSLVGDDDQIQLGTLPTDRLITWSDAREFVVRLVRYALVRDTLREELRRTSPSRPASAPRVSAADRYAATLSSAGLAVGQRVRARWEGTYYHAEVLAPGARRGESGEVFLDGRVVPAIGPGLIRVGWRGERLYSDLEPSEIVAKLT